MGLFSWFKKNKQKTSDSKSGKLRSEEYAINDFYDNVPPQQFYKLCIQDYHRKAKELGYAERDLIFIPELIDFGQKSILWFLKNEELQKQFSSPAEWYFTCISTAIRCGIIFALKWHFDFAGLNKPCYVESVMEEGPISISKDIIERDLGMDNKDFYVFCMKIFKCWAVMHEPYWKLADPRQYTFYATLAAYQLGISMILCKYGF